MKQQFIFLNGAVPSENYGSYHDYLRSVEYDPYEPEFRNWNKTLGKYLWDDWEYLRAPFAKAHFADYEWWKILFEKVIPYIRPWDHIWATSLWASFLLKYVGENHFPTKLGKVFLIAPAIKDTKKEVLGSFAVDLDRVYRLQNWCDQIYIYHSRDDELVPFEQSLELKIYFPDAIFREFDDRGHFYKEETLPELIQDLKN